MLSDYERRWATIRDRLNETGFDAFVVEQLDNIRYLSATHLPPIFHIILNRVIVPVDGDPIGIAHPIEKNRAKEHCAIKDVKFYPGFSRNPEVEKAMIKRVLEDFGAKSVLCDVEDRIDNTKVRKDDFLADMRSCKDSRELESIRKAVELVDYGAKVLSEEILRQGRTEAEAANELDYAIRCKGAQGMVFTSMVASGKNSSFPHHANTNKKISNGELVICDFGAVYEGYCSDLTRTFPVGSVSEKLSRIYDIVLEGQLAAIKAIKPGGNVKSVEETCRSIFEKYGYNEYFCHSIGHGIGLNLSEEPRVTIASTMKFKKGYVFTVEPGIYVPDLGGARIEDDVYIGDEVEVLTKAPKFFKSL